MTEPHRRNVRRCCATAPPRGGFAYIAVTAKDVSSHMPPIRKENLLPEDSFIHYCLRDELDGQKLRKRITPEFLRAAEKDGLIVPLCVEKQKRKKDETEEEVDVRFYSPFQIYLVAGLIENDIDEDGVLRDPENKDWQKQQNTRYIKWGGWSAFNADIVYHVIGTVMLRRRLAYSSRSE